MRRGVVLFILVNVLILSFLVRSVFTLLTLLVEDASADAIHRSDIPSPNSSLIESRPQIIPKIIHQTYINESIPEHWIEPQQSCINLHPDYEYKLWTNEKSREFIAKEYPWFLETFDGYRYPIQRADAIRYFVLAYYGGTYIDLDDGCQRRLDPLLSYPAWVRRTKPTGISNDAMGAVPQHPFFLRVVESLQAYDKHWFLPYITVMYSTGPLFLSVVWKEYMAESFGMDRVRVLMPDEYNRFSWSFFTHHVGNSWHGADAQLIFWMCRYWVLLTVVGFTLAGCVGFCMWVVYRRLLLLGHRYRYTRLAPGGISVSKIRRRPFARMPRFFRRISSSSIYSDEESGRKEGAYSE
ncbi:MIPC synthase subunit (SurA), putative [Talaromyces stipitatus ATCC 10500]|uniref:MIPC synthase subunit (SurA), putative n=1 Tax=Talaromyces stipitatus (strain ATCC 10500 / CBS 375.48 / QM 6759 / NRRL 1006) TaxID=441959 RepID=B8MS45_TALSN|nr:MIPC synthase subunit (SurA), putative [Talaromyces stipitatus ATCC 10500]XP_002488105.1 MIPC synthase subunit (SurA), putative [Talaromyces stipitatus ATCC 10500]EED12450.1 MIPC synthase subunit (SurA), putative [Talaromyces stipitatus ATCC 10500]EED12451.1 MIPC synthase subunit (SurA), putative [Talaromyces stipitatus ATCC 10500]